MKIATIPTKKALNFLVKKTSLFVVLFGLFSYTLTAQTVTTDKADYSPGETAYASGSGWTPFETVELNVHEEPVVHPDVVTNTTADVNGEFSNVVIYNFDATDYGSSFTLTATGQTSGYIATAFFTDGGQDLWAWRNQGGAANTWNQGTTIQQANSIYAEGEVIPFRWTIATGNPAPELQEGTFYTVELDWAYAGGTSEPENLFFDYLTSYDATETITTPPFGPTTDLGPGFQGTYITTIPIPNDTGDVAPNPPTVVHPAGNFTLYNIDPASVTFSSYIVDNVNANQEDRKLQITFKPSDNDGTLLEFLNVGIAWGGHLATQIDYGFENGAAFFPGASPQMVVDLDPSSSGDVTNLNINPSAIVPMGQITIVKDANPDDAEDFGFTITGPAGANITSPFALDDDADGTLSNQITFFGLFEGVYTITENAVSGWSLTSITPVESGGDDTTVADISSTDVGARTATITVADGEIWVVTYLNDVDPCVPPTITTQPTNETVCEGSGTSFSVVATGTSLTYQWKENGIDLADGGVYSGTQTDTLSISDTTGLGGNTYEVVVTESLDCSTTSSVVTLTVTPQPVEPTTECWETATFNNTTCVWDVTGTQPVEPTTECWETATFNNTTCVWDVTGTQPVEPTTECWETATFNNTTCVWDVTGTQPVEPTTECWETATFNNTTCVWDVTGTQPVEPTTECWETATFNNTTCVWDVTGTQPVEPTTECWETATFNNTTCVWDVTGTQPVEPTTECWETATFNNTTCVWDVTGTQPVEPTTECWETATFNNTTCVWDVTGTQPVEPTTECWETATFNNTTCVWDVTGTQPVEPTTECWETATFNNTTCVWDVTGTQPVEPTTECWETATFNNTTCVWDVTGTQPVEPTTECWETATFNNTTCVWDVTGTQPVEPTTECWETATFNNTTCVWDVTGTQPVEPTTECWETATFNNTTCVWDVTGTPLSATGTSIGALCFGDSTGSIDLTVTGGTAPYTYQWDNGGGTTQDLIDFPSGIYNVIVTDANGCRAFACIHIDGPREQLTCSTTYEDASCSDGSGGSIDLTVTGGTAPYEYTWIGPDNFVSRLEDISNLSAGVYEVTIVDANGCTIPNSCVVTIQASGSITGTITHTNVLCIGEANGTIDLTVTGGTPPYSYNWYGPNNFEANTEDLSDLEPGTYDVIITDANGCSPHDVCDVTITEPDELSCSIVQDNPASGPGASDGQATVTPIGGVGPYTYRWDNGDTNATATGLEAGKYDVLVVDANGCKTTCDVTITQENNDCIIRLKVLLEGPYDTDTGHMFDNLRTTSNIPTTSPYIDETTCTASVFNVSGTNAIVDWIWIEVRDSADGTTVVASRSALLQADGDVVDTDGASPVVFDVPNANYYIMVGHRNHVGVITANTVSLSEGSNLNLDLTGDSTLIEGGTNGVATMGNGDFALFSGDCNGNGQVQNSDKNEVQLLLGTSGLLDADLDMNGQVQNSDIQNKLNPNLGNGEQFSRIRNLSLFAKRKNN